MVSGKSVGVSFEQIEGRQPIREALRAGRSIHRLYVAEGTRGNVVAEILELARARGIPVERISRDALEARARTRAPQGLVAEAEPYRTTSWREGVRRARERGAVPLLLALDGIEDPQNLGALLRNAAAFGVDAVLLSERRSAPLGAAASKASAGALEHLIIDRVPNLERALASCKQEGLWVVALAAGSSTDVASCELLAEPVVIVVGSEGKGVSALIRKRCDQLVRIPMTATIDSLNASVAGAICLWEAFKRRR